MPHHGTHRAALAAAILLALTACGSPGSDAGGASSASSSPTASNPQSSNGSATPSDSPAPAGSDRRGFGAGKDLDTTSPDSPTVLVNKTHPLEPRDYAPKDLRQIGAVQLRAEAADAAQKLIDAAARDGVTISPISGYRSYQTQVGTYQLWVNTYGQDKADVGSARPGYSEHQTGWAMDIGGSGGCDLQVCFRDTPAAKWLAEHATEYGFILRFPWMEHETTGYWYESWHARYIGTDAARKYRDSGAATYEDFVGASPAPTYKDQ